MRQRGRPPASSSVVTLPVERAKRPEPPEHLSKAEAAHWRQIVGALPAPFFRADYLPMLETLVCTIEGTRGVEAILRAEPVMSGKWRTAAARHDVQSRTIASLSTKTEIDATAAGLLGARAGRDGDVRDA